MSAGGSAILTRSDHVSGSDRVCEALAAFDPGRRFDIVVNLQGDLPMIDPGHLGKAVAALGEAATDIGTLAVPIACDQELADPNVVKVGGLRLPSGYLKALSFSRSAAFDEGPLYHHIGLYAYRRAALEHFVALPPSARECRERLEQLRALENGMRIDVALVDTPAFGVDTPADLDRARTILRQR